MANFITRLFTKEPTAPAKTVHIRRFNAAVQDRLTSGWLTTVGSINQELKSDLNRLRERSRDLSKNNDYAKKFINLVVANVVGPNGFNFQSRVMSNASQQDKPANDAIEAAFARWAKKGVCEVSGRMSFAEFQRAVARCFSRDGEYLVRVVRGKPANNDFGYALQLLDVDRLDSLFNRNASNGVNAVIMGVEVDNYRRPVAYHIFTSHPSESPQAQRSRERVPASDIYHDFIYENPEQIRGIPWMSASMLTLHHLGEFEQSALIAARKGANTLGFIVSPDGSTITPADGNDDPINISVPGEYDTLPEGYDFKPYDTKYPDAMLGPFVKNFLRRASAGLNVAYNGLANDLEGVNFSSIRSGVIDEREQWMTIQSWFADAFLSPLFDEWLRAALLKNAITLPNGSALPAAKLDKFTAHTWQGRRWQWVDPMRDIEASLLAIKNGLTSPYTIASQMGLDLDDVMQDLARANATAQSLGLPAFAAPAPVAATPVNASQPAPVDQAKAITVNVAAPVTNITTPDVRIESPVHIHEKAFHIDAPITTPEPKVTLEASIHVPERSVTINTPQVNNEVKVQPAVATRDEITRDANGDIKSIQRTPITH